MKKKPSKPTRRTVKPGPAPAGRPVKAKSAPAKAPVRKRGSAPAVAPPGPVSHALTAAARSATRGDSSRAKYVYCIIRSAEPRRFGPIGLGSEPTEVSSVSFREIAAVISDTPE